MDGQKNKIKLLFFDTILFALLPTKALFIGDFIPDGPFSRPVKLSLTQSKRELKSKRNRVIIFLIDFFLYFHCSSFTTPHAIINSRS